jgi:hypothetical protein
MSGCAIPGGGAVSTGEGEAPLAAGTAEAAEAVADAGGMDGSQMVVHA